MRGTFNIRVSPMSEREEAVGANAQAKRAELLNNLLSQCYTAYDTIIPYLVQVWIMLHKLNLAVAPYHPTELLYVLVGFGMVYFGGTFMTLIAAFEAYRISAWEETARQINILRHNFNIAWDASREDDKIDDDKDGIPDVQQIESSELIQRKLKILLTSVDPMQVSSALTGIYVGFLAVVATLRSRFAMAITLGASLGDTLHDFIYPVVNPVAKRVVPEDYHKWIPVVITYSTKAAGVMVAWFIERLITSVHSSIKGAFILVPAVFHFLKVNGWCAKDFEWTGCFHGQAKLFCLAIAASGLYLQITHAFQLPFPMSFFMFPFTLAEHFLMFVINQ